MELFGRRPTRKPRRNIAPHVFLGLAAAAVIVLIFTRGGSDQPDPASGRQPAAAEAETSSPASSGPAEEAAAPTAAAETSASPEAPASAEASAAAEAAQEEADGAGAAEEPEGADDPGAAAEPAPEEEEQEETSTALSAEASRYLLALSAFGAAADELASDITAVNRSWDEEKGDAPDEPSYRARYREAESALEDILDRVRGFHAGVRNQPVPAPVAAQGGPLADQAARLPGLAEDVLAGLRRPRPDDGSARRAALADFTAAAAGFSRAAAALAARIEQNAPALGLTAGGADPGGAAPQTGEAAAAYLEGLAGFREELNRLAADVGGIHRSWDEEKGGAPDESSYRARYREAESALEDALSRVRGFHARVQAHPVPASIQALGGGPESLTPRLVDSAEGMLAGLRRPRPDDGSARRAALADFNEAVRSFGVMVDRLAAAAG